MARYDPLDQIMGTLRQKGAVDPAHTAQRKAEMQKERGALGARQPEKRRRDVPAAADRPTQQEEAMLRGEIGTPESIMPVAVDAMNESIIALKVEIHREQNPERRRELETAANQLRKQIQSLGGEPIWADESVEEGIQKLMGRGYIGWTGLDLPDRQAPQADPRLDLYADPHVRTQTTAAPDWLAPTGVVGQPRETTAGAGPFHPHAPEPEPRGREVPEWTAPAVGTGAAPAQWGGAPDWLGQMGAMPQISAPGVAFQAPAITAPPTLTVNDEYVNNLISQYGLEPRSEEEIAEHAAAIVERQKWELENVIHRELERFEREHPPEFARAEQRIMNAAAAIEAEQQEEFAARGMFYSSVMSNAARELDAKTMDMIGEIANDAASYVLELRQDLRDIAQWAILEEEMLRHELEMIERDHAMRLTEMRLNVAMWADQMALDAWAHEQNFQLQRAQMNLQAAIASAQMDLQAQIANADMFMGMMQLQLGYAELDLRAWQTTQQLARSGVAASADTQMHQMLAMTPEGRALANEMGFNVNTMSSSELAAFGQIVPGAYNMKTQNLQNQLLAADIARGQLEMDMWQSMGLFDTPAAEPAAATPAATPREPRLPGIGTSPGFL